MRSTPARRRLSAMCGAAMAVAVAFGGCSDDGTTAGEGDDTEATTEATDEAAESGDETTTTTSAAPAGGGAVNEEFCGALSAEFDALDALVDSFETGSVPGDDLVQAAEEANDALEAATPDDLTDLAGAIYVPIGGLLEDLAAGGTDTVINDYVTLVGSAEFFEPLGELATQCGSLFTG